MQLKRKLMRRHFIAHITILMMGLAGSSRVSAQELPTETVVESLVIPPAGELILPDEIGGSTLAPVQPNAMAEEVVADEDRDTMLRGPVHEAYAEQVNADPVPGLIITAVPPEAIEEVPPEVRPDGRTVEWISGYWAWDEDQDDFLWVSGVWRDIPQGFRWLPGYWAEVEGGYQWVSGTWVSRQTAEIEYIETAPPQSLEQGPTGPSPTVEHIWIPGCWSWQETRYAWRPGYWSTGYADWVWVPARYHWTPRGFYHCSGYWDYPLERRGVLFAPRYFNLNARAVRGRRYTPQIVVSSSLLQVHLWVRPRYRHYYFGDYYGAPYASRGLLPWHQFHRQHRGIDPLFVHYSRGRGGSSYFNQRDTQFQVFVREPDRRPSHTFQDQSRWAGLRQNNVPLRRELLGDRLQNVVERSVHNSGDVRFVKLEANQRQRLQRDADQVRELVTQRRVAEISAIRGRDGQGGGFRSDFPQKIAGAAIQESLGQNKTKGIPEDRLKSRSVTNSEGERRLSERPTRLKLPQLEPDSGKSFQSTGKDRSDRGSDVTAESRGRNEPARRESARNESTRNESTRNESTRNESSQSGVTSQNRTRTNEVRSPGRTSSSIDPSSPERSGIGSRASSRNERSSGAGASSRTDNGPMPFRDRPVDRSLEKAQEDSKSAMNQSPGSLKSQLSSDRVTHSIRPTPGSKTGDRPDEAKRTTGQGPAPVGTEGSLGRRSSLERSGQPDRGSRPSMSNPARSNSNDRNAETPRTARPENAKSIQSSRSSIGSERREETRSSAPTPESRSRSTASARSEMRSINPSSPRSSGARPPEIRNSEPRNSSPRSSDRSRHSGGPPSSRGDRSSQGRSKP